MLSHLQRSFLLWQMGENTKTHKRTVYREWESLQHSILNVMFPSNLSHQGSGNPAEVKRKTLQELERMEDTKETRFTRYNRTDAHQRLSACTGPHRPKLDGIPALRVEVDKSAHTCQPRDSSNWHLLPLEKFIFSNSILLGIQTTLKRKPHAQQ